MYLIVCHPRCFKVSSHWLRVMNPTRNRAGVCGDVEDDEETEVLIELPAKKVSLQLFSLQNTSRSFY